jgi:hypothetical protein
MKRSTTMGLQRLLIIAVAATGCVASLSAASLAEVMVVEVRKNSGTDADFARAKASSADANTAFGEGDIRGALSHAEAAYRAYSNASTAMQMATIYSKTNKDRSAFKWYLLARNHNPTEAVISSIEDALKAHGGKAKLGVVRVETTPKDAKVDIDGGAGVTVGGAYFGVSFGEHEIVVSAPKHSAANLAVKVSKGSIQTLKAQLKPVVAEVKKPKEVESASIALPLGLIIGGVVAAGAGAGLHLWGLGADSELADQNGKWTAQGLSNEESLARFDGFAGDASTGSTVAFVLYGVGAAAIVTGAVIWALQGSDSGGDGKVDVVVAPAFIPAGGGLTLGGTF